MNIFGIHFCADEARQLLFAVPFLTVGWIRFKMYFKGKTNE